MILSGIRNKADELSSLLVEKLIPLYRDDRTTISNENEQMRPDRAQAEELASDLRQEASRLANRTTGRDQPI